MNLDGFRQCLNWQYEYFTNGESLYEWKNYRKNPIWILIWRTSGRSGNILLIEVRNVFPALFYHLRLKGGFEVLRYLNLQAAIAAVDLFRLIASC